MASARLNSRTTVEGADEANRWRTITIVLLAVMIIGGGLYAWKTGLLAPLLGQSVNAAPAASVSAPAGAAATAGSGSAQAVAPADSPAPPAGSDTGLQTLQSTGAGIAGAVGSTDAAQSDAAQPSAAAPAKVATAAESVAAVQQSTVRVPAITRRGGVTLFADDGSPLALLSSGVTLEASGRSADGAWLAAGGDAGSGWVLASQVIAYGLDDLAELPLPDAVAAAAAPAAVPAAAEAPQSTIAEMAEVLASAGTIENAGARGPDSVLLKATVATTGARLNVRAAPGTSAAIVAKASNGASYDASARSEQGDWLLLQSGGDPVGWVSASLVELAGDASTLPVSTQMIDSPPLSEVPAASQSAPAPVAGASALETARAAAAGLFGKLVFQQSPGGTIYSYDLESGALRALTHGFDPAISPDGTQVAFVRDGGEAGLYLIDIDGSNERVIFDERGSLSSPKWSEDGQSIVFARNDEAIDCYQFGPNECLIPEVAEKRMPAGMLASIPLTKEYQWKLSVVDADGNHFHDIPSLNYAKAPDWSAGGVVYQSKAGIQRTDDAEGVVSQEVIFVQLGPVFMDPDQQPGGGQIVFQVQGAAQWDLWVVNADGSGKTALTRPVTTLVDSLPSNVAPAYSPDGQHIVFLSNRTDQHAAGAWRIWVMDADGSNPRVLPIDVPIDYTFGAEQAVSWGA